MRLIDADAIEKDTEWDAHDGGFMSYSQLQIDNAPTIDAKPVIRGHWIPRSTLVREPFGKNYDCSVCGKNNIQYNYCPSCGADMREVQDESNID